MKILNAIKTKHIVDLSAKDAKTFLLRDDSYFTEKIPSYIHFDRLLAAVDKELRNSHNQIGKRLGQFNDIPCANYVLYANKDSKFAWRPFQFIHPLLYVQLVNIMTSPNNWNLIVAKFREFADLPRIKCASVPVVDSPGRSIDATQILTWWDKVEQESIRRALCFSHLIVTDITDCYGTLYTHSVSWAIHGIPQGKIGRKDKSLLGNQIDTCLREMHWGQTNGIPQGSITMNLIAELLLGAIDVRLCERTKKENIEDYEIIRFRDDYRIFVNDENVGMRIVKILSEVLRDFGLRLGAAKTAKSDDVISASIKSDKLAWMERPYSSTRFIEKKLLLIYEHSLMFPNGGSVIGALSEFNKEIDTAVFGRDSLRAMVAIVVEIAFRNSRAYGYCIIILSKLLQQMSTDEKSCICEQIIQKFSCIPNTGLLELWLQRICYPAGIHPHYNDTLCNMIENPFNYGSLWDLSPIKDISAVHDVFINNTIIDYEELSMMAPILPESEIDAFANSQLIS